MAEYQTITAGEVREARERLGMTSEALGRALGHDDGGRNVRKWEAGKHPPSPPAAILIRYILKYGPPWRAL